jgi:gliding motility-associated lipoprotein GldH
MKQRLLLLCFTLFACGCNDIYREYNKNAFEGNVWDQQNPVTFTPKIEDLNQTYDLTLGVRHIYGMQHKSITVRVTTVTPSGKETQKKYKIQIRDEDGDYIGKCAGDLCDVEVTVEDHIKYEEVGTYKYIVYQAMALRRVSGIIEFGMIIQKN